MTATDPPVPILLGLPKGRTQKGVLDLLHAAGIEVRLGARAYRPAVSLPGFETKLLKPQNIAEMLHAGSRDLGFAGADWVDELELDLVELLDTGLDPVRIVAAAPAAILRDGELPSSVQLGRPLVIASEYERLSRRWIESRGLDARFVRTFGATEVFPPEDADLIVDNSATGSTLAANKLHVVDVLMESSTRLYASHEAWNDPRRRPAISSLLTLVRSVLDARARVLLELNVSEADLERVIATLPAMRRPTIARLHGSEGYAVKAAVPRADLPALIPRLKQCGGSDLVVTTPSQIVP